jgi:hypothetical protein
VQTSAHGHFDRCPAADLLSLLREGADSSAYERLLGTYPAQERAGLDSSTTPCTCENCWRSAVAGRPSSVRSTRPQPGLLRSTGPGPECSPPLPSVVPQSGLLASKFREGPPTEPVDRFRAVGRGGAGRRPECRLGAAPVPLFRVLRWVALFHPALRRSGPARPQRAAWPDVSNKAPQRPAQATALLPATSMGQDQARGLRRCLHTHPARRDQKAAVTHSTAACDRRGAPVPASSSGLAVGAVPVRSRRVRPAGP